MRLTGATFHLKDDLKRLGAKFCPKTKSWSYTKQENDSFQALEELLNSPKRRRKA